MTRLGRFLYSLYGLQLESNLALPGLVPSESTTPDVQIVLGQPLPKIIKEAQPWYVSPTLDEFGTPVITVWKASDRSAYHFIYCDRTEFVVNSTGTRIHALWSDEYSLENTCYYLVGQIAAFVLRLRGVVCLHGSSVLIGDRALIISGDSGSGKSTTAAALTNKGFRVLSEDVSAVVEKDHQPFVHVGYPRINLWPDTVHSVFGRRHELPRIVATWDKLYLDIAASDQFHKTEAPIGAIYVLDSRTESSNAPFIEDLTPSESLVLLLTNTHGRYLVDKEMREREFAVTSRIVKQIPVRRVVPHVELARLGQMVNLILKDFQEILNEKDSLIEVS